MLLRKFSSCVIGCFMFILLAIPAQAAEWTMKIAFAGIINEYGDDNIAAAAMEEYIEKNSGGRIQVDRYPAGQLGNYKETFEQIQAGVLEAAHTTVDGILPFIPEFTVLDLPYLMPDDATARNFMRGKFLDTINRDIAKVMPNIQLASMCNSGNWRSFYTNKKQVKDLADVKGLKIRTINSQTQQELVRQLGGNSTIIAWGELYTGLATGVADGVKLAISDILSAKLEEHLNYAFLDKHSYLFGFWWVSKSWLHSLPEDLQKVVLEGMRIGAEKISDFNENSEEAHRKVFTSKGKTLLEPTAEQVAGFAKIGADVEAWYLEKFGKKGADLLAEYKEAIKIAQEQK